MHTACNKLEIDMKVCSLDFRNKRQFHLLNIANWKGTPPFLDLTYWLGTQEYAFRIHPHIGDNILERDTTVCTLKLH